MTTKTGSSAGVPAAKALKKRDFFFLTYSGHIRAPLLASQSPNLFVLGKARAFLAQKPFTV